MFIIIISIKSIKLKLRIKYKIAYTRICNIVKLLTLLQFELIIDYPKR